MTIHNVLMAVLFVMSLFLFEQLDLVKEVTICAAVTAFQPLTVTRTGITPATRNSFQLFGSDESRNTHTNPTRRDLLDGIIVTGAAAITSGFQRIPAAAAASTNDDIPRLAKEWYENAPVTGSPGDDRSFFPALTPPFRNRATYRYDLGRNAWALEQLLAFANVTATIRTNVIRLESTGGLWVHSPLYPTQEFCSLLDELGTVEHVVLPCNAFEHKAPLAAFCKRYPKASVWIAPGQYAPLGECGLTLQDKGKPSCRMGTRVDGIFQIPSLDKGLDSHPPWADEFDFTTLYVNLPENAGPVSEVAFVHKPTKTLIATDAVVYIPKDPKPPPIFGTYFSQEELEEPTFWARTVLQSVFLPLRIEASDSSYPGFTAIQERLLRAPILRGFNDARAPEEGRHFVNTISNWDFDRILTSHFASPIVAQPKDVRNAFAYLYADTYDGVDFSALPPISCRDWELLDNLNDVIAKNKLGAPATFDYRSGCKD